MNDSILHRFSSPLPCNSVLAAFSGSGLGHVAYLRSIDIGHHGAYRGGLAWSSGLACSGSLPVS